MFLKSGTVCQFILFLNHSVPRKGLYTRKGEKNQAGRVNKAYTVGPTGSRLNYYHFSRLN